jgi:recombination protein RecA
MANEKTSDEVLAGIKKSIPNVRIFKGSDPEVQVKIEPFGIEAIDQLCLGIKCGGYTILYGPNKSGKSTLVGRAIAQMQRSGRKVLVVDLENRMDPRWLKRQGVDLEALNILVGGKDFEEDMDATFALIREGVYSGIVIDSITAKAARGELEDKAGKQKSMGDDTVALLARKLSEWFRKISPAVGFHKVPVIILSQVRATNLHQGAYQDMTGGNAPKHWASTILRITRADKITATKDGQKIELGYWMRVELKKTSLCGHEGREVQLPFYFGIGIDDLATAVRALFDLEIVQKTATNRFEFQGTSYASENQLVDKARENPKLADEIIAAVAKLTPKESTVTELDPMAELPETDEEEKAEAEDYTVRKNDEDEDEYVCKAKDCGQVLTSLRGLRIHQGKNHKS